MKDLMRVPEEHQMTGFRAMLLGVAEDSFLRSEIQKYVDWIIDNNRVRIPDFDNFCMELSTCFDPKPDVYWQDKIKKVLDAAFDIPVAIKDGGKRE